MTYGESGEDGLSKNYPVKIRYVSRFLFSKPFPHEMKVKYQTYF